MSGPIVCDRCPAVATHEVFTDWGPLYFCTHHLRTLAPGLADKGPDWTINGLGTDKGDTR